MKWGTSAEYHQLGGDDTESVSLGKEGPIFEDEVLETGHSADYAITSQRAPSAVQGAMGV